MAWIMARHGSFAHHREGKAGFAYRRRCSSHLACRIFGVLLAKACWDTPQSICLFLSPSDYFFLLSVITGISHTNNHLVHRVCND